ncbi:cx9C motif-containing protein 4 [Sitodiplosis mosellana]|uniref:cx9C motif-containing protein 4 n=1 Tax=Sitodiplosis mosellana TaxID=263140 RepID=UPI002443FDC4|nr:cx9C motif-containing protein 4 [Sitodiplosis mosellana]
MYNNTRKDPCKKNACLIQKCLKENNYQESACVEVLELMRECCRQYKGQSICCEGIDIEPKRNTSKSTNTVNTKSN